MRSSVLALLVVTLALTAVAMHAAPVLALDNGLGLTPQMAWNSWNHFGCNLSETTVRATAEAIIELGLANVGYNYINMDGQSVSEGACVSACLFFAWLTCNRVARLQSRGLL